MGVIVSRLLPLLAVAALVAIIYLGPVKTYVEKNGLETRVLTFIAILILFGVIGIVILLGMNTY